MDLANLAQFDQEMFFKLFGFYLKDSRMKLNRSVDDVAQLSQMLSPDDIVLIEAGLKNISQAEFNVLCETLTLDSAEIFNLAKITQVQYLINVLKETNIHASL